MDNRRLSTADVLASEILNMPAPQKACPPGSHLESVDECKWSTESLKAGLLAGGLEGCFYYGYWTVWKTERGYSGELLQYRQKTDEFADLTLDDALRKAEEWASGCQG